MSQLQTMPMSKWQTMPMSEKTARYELSHLNLHCLQKPLIAFGSERAKGLFHIQTNVERAAIHVVIFISSKCLFPNIYDVRSHPDTPCVTGNALHILAPRHIFVCFMSKYRKPFKCFMF